MRRTSRWGALLLVTAVAACGGGSAGGPGERPSVPTIALAPPRLDGEMSLEEAVAARRSVRDFAAQPIGEADLAQLLWACQGVTEEAGRGRAAPSAGGTYPLEVYTVDAAGLTRYLPGEHALELLGAADLRESLAEAAGGQRHVAEAAAVVVITADFGRTEAIYGARAERYVHLEAGHAAQNLLLEAAALGLAAVPVGAFDDAGVAAVIGLPATEAPLYLIPVGHPGGG